MDWKKVGHWLWEHVVSPVLAAPLVTLVLVIVARIAEKLDLTARDSPFPPLAAILRVVDKYPFRVIGVGLAIAVLISIARRLYRWASLYVERAKIIDGFGARKYSEHATRKERAQNWNQCIEGIQDAVSDIRILGATGQDTFVASDAPLHEYLKNYSGNIHILLMAPDNPFLEERAHSLGIDIAVYQAQIKNTLDYCRTLKVRNRHLSVALYRQPAIWKMVIANSYLWLQHYKSGKHVEETPVYVINGRTASSTLYDGFVDVYQRRWAKSTKVI